MKERGKQRESSERFSKSILIKIKGEINGINK
jgi:hypothetical protein